MEKYFDPELAGRVLTPRGSSAKICRIFDDTIQWEYVNSGTYYSLTGNIIDVEDDNYLLLAETTVNNVYLPIVDGVSEWEYTVPGSFDNNKKNRWIAAAAVAAAIIILLKK